MTDTSPDVVEIRRGNQAVTALDWGGDGPAVVLLHPNGFCGGLYEPIAHALRRTCRPVAIDLRGHGATHAPADPELYHFVHLADDVLAVLDEMALESPIGIGGSLGGAIAVMVDMASPGRWQRLLLAEPVAFPLDAFGDAPDNPMATGARQRRRTFPDRHAMAAAYRRRPPLSELAPEALDAYLRWGTRTDDTGTHLRCDPEIEATIFEISGTPHGAAAAWNHLPHLSCPVTIVAGKDTFLPDIFNAQARHARAPLELVAGGHFVLHEDTRRGVDLIARHTLHHLNPPPR